MNVLLLSWTVDQLVQHSQQDAVRKNQLFT